MAMIKDAERYGLYMAQLDGALERMCAAKSLMELLNAAGEIEVHVRNLYSQFRNDIARGGYVFTPSRDMTVLPKETVVYLGNLDHAAMEYAKYHQLSPGDYVYAVTYVGRCVGGNGEGGYGVWFTDDIPANEVVCFGTVDSCCPWVKGTVGPTEGDQGECEA